MNPRLKLLFLSLALAGLASAQEDIKDKALITGSGIDRANDWFVVGDASTTGTDPILRRMKFSELVNVSGMYSTLEPALGNPGTNGYVLSSTTAGVRSWVSPAVAAGGITDAGAAFPAFAQAETPQGQRTVLGVNQLGIASQTKNTLARVFAALRTNTMTPLRIGFWGDSVSSYLALSNLMAGKGGIYGANAGATYTGGAAVGSNTSIWVTGLYDNVPNGGTVTYKVGGVTSVSGDTLRVYYVKESTGGTFNVETSADDGATWQAATGGTGVSANNTTQIGAVFSAALSTVNYPTYLVRVTGASSGGVKIIGWGIYHANANGGVIGVSGLLNGNGNGWDDQVDTPVEILNPILTDLNMDLVICRSQDYASMWAADGDFATMYSRLKAVTPNCDLVLVSSTPQGPVHDADGSNYAAAVANQKQFCLTNNETFIDASTWIGTYAEGVAKGIVQDDQSGHLTAAGYAMSNMIIWDSLFLGRVPLGRIPLDGPNGSPSVGTQEMSFRAGFADRSWLDTSALLRMKGFRVAHTLYPTVTAADFSIEPNASVVHNFKIKMGANECVSFQGSTGAGIYPTTHNGGTCGRAANRFSTGYFTGMDVTGALALTPVAQTAPNTITATGGATNSNTSITMSASTLYVGQLITGAGIPADTVITATNGTTTATISRAATATATGLTFTLSGVTAPVLLTNHTTALTTTAPAQPITLADGTVGQIKTIMHVATSGGGTAVLTPTTKTGFTTITFANVGDTVTLQYYTTLGWMVVSIRGAVAA